MKDRTNQEWLTDLRTPGLDQEEALSDLRVIIMKGLPYALSKWMTSSDPKFEPLVEEVAQDTLLRVLDKMDTFEGRSKFTTWVHKIAIRLALTELRRRRWKNVSLESLVEGEDKVIAPQLLKDPSPDPHLTTEQGDLLSRVQRIITEELTEKQRTAIVAALIQGMPLEEVARRMDTNRNALYKLMHDARLRLRDRLKDEGLTPEDVLASFES
jgi:RNA polymerase sigma-70 factor (ECF subfamily)